VCLKNGMKKFIFLSLALILPALVFVFLKRFGKNEFVVPVFHVQAAEWTLAGCPSVEIPLRVTAGFGEPKIRIITTQTEDVSVSSFSRVAENINPELYVVVNTTKDSIRCKLLMRDNDTTVLLDSIGQIRGYYSLTSLEETDRLVLEMKILLKQY
jgi:hypothetical protein